MNILITSAGRRTNIVNYFKEALKPYGGKVFALNSDVNAPAQYVADAHGLPPLIYEAAYPGFLLKYCKEHQIKLIISLFDLDIPVLSRLKDQFLKEGIIVLVADEEFALIANDKWQTYKFLIQNGFYTLPTFLHAEEFLKAIDDGKASFPAYVKPRWGMGSIAVFKAENEEDLYFYSKKAKKEIENSYLEFESRADIDRAVIIQMGMPGDEYGLDIINDLKGEYITTVVKKKLAIRCGETDVAITVVEPLLSKLGEKLALISRHPANMDVDVFFDGKTPYILEFNPRIGGGYPFSHLAGINLPLAIVKWCHHEHVNVEQWLSPKIGIKGMKGISMILSPDE